MKADIVFFYNQKQWRKKHKKEKSNFLLLMFWKENEQRKNFENKLTLQLRGAHTASTRFKL
jgi:hypothetical protein